MAVAGARMLSVEEASRYAGGFDDPARLVASFAGVTPSVPIMVYLSTVMPRIYYSGDWKMWKFPIQTISQISHLRRWNSVLTQCTSFRKLRLLHRCFSGRIRQCCFRCLRHETNATGTTSEMRIHSR